MSGVLGAAVPVLLAFGTAGVAQEIGQTTRADDLPPEFKVLWATDSDRDYRWTLVGKNEKAAEQEKLHAEFPAMRYVLTEPDPEAMGKNRGEVDIPVFDLGSYHGAAA